MKVLHIIPTLGSGGAEKMLIDIIKEMVKQDITCELAILTSKENFFEEELLKLNISYYYGPTKKVYDIRNIFFIKELIKNNHYDYIHTHLFSPQLFTPIAIKLAKKNIPLITTEHSTHNRRREIQLFKQVDNWIYKQYKGIVAITEETKKAINIYLPYTKEKTIVIENGINLSNYKNADPIARKKLISNYKEGDVLVLMVAGMRNQKDPETLIRASKFLPSNYKILFVGDGERMAEVQAYSKRYGSTSISFLGSRTDVASIMKAVDIFVLSSKWEGFGLVTIEAAATGLPVIASNVGGLSEVVKEIGGEVFEPYNEEELASKILNAKSILIKESKLDKYKIQNTVREYIKLYQSLN